jgi:replicative DNA helicase
MTDELTGHDVVQGALQSAEPWEVPVPLLELPQLPAFPVDSLPAWVHDWVKAIAAEKGASVDIAANLALAVVSGAIARHVQVSPRPGWYEPVNLYVIAALIPGQAKTPVFKAALRPVRMLEAKRIAEHTEVAQAATLASKVMEKQERELVNEAGPKADPEALAAKLKDFADQFGQTLDAGPSPRLLTEDVTPEGLAGLIGDHGRIMVASDEGAAMFENLAGRYTRGSSSWDLFNKAHAAADLAVDRKGSAPIIVFDPALTLAITTQPAMLRALAGKPDAGERGVLARPLYAIPAPVFAETPTPAAPQLLLDEYSRRVANVYNDVPGLERDEDGLPRPRQLGLAVDARARFQDWERELNGERRKLSGDDEEAGLYLGWLSKLAGQTARLAACLHVAQYWTDGVAVTTTIDDSAVEAAIALAGYYREHARAAFGLMGQLPEQRRAIVILRWLATRTAEQTAEGLTVRDVHRTRGKGTTAAEVRAALKLLEEHGYLRVERDRAAGGARGPAPEVVRLNPGFLTDPQESSDKPDELSESGASRAKPVGFVGPFPRDTPETEGYLAFVAETHRNGHITTTEALMLERLCILTGPPRRPERSK